MLSLHLGWVNVIPASGPGGITMKGMALAFTLFLFSSSSMAADCFDMAGRDYRIDPDLLRAISWQESKWVVGAIGKNPGTGYGAGLMQIDSQHHMQLSRYGIKPQNLLTDACLNIYTGAYYLALAFQKWGRISRNISSMEYCSTRGASSSRCVITRADIEAYSS